MYQNDYHQNPDFQDENFNSNNISNLNTIAMSDNTHTSTTSQDNTPTGANSQSTTKAGYKVPLIVQAVQNKKGLYPKLKTALLKKASRDIDEGKNANMRMDKFIFDLIEEGLKSLEK